MELELKKDEVKAVMLEWAQQKFPGMFNTVELDGYRGDYCRFSKSEPEKEE